MAEATQTACLLNSPTSNVRKGGMSEQSGTYSKIAGQAGAVTIGGTEARQERRRQRKLFYLGMMIMYLLLGIIVFHFVEDWYILQTIVFNLSILTGVGYGHLIPASQAGMVFTAFYILAGLMLFAAIVGQIMDWITEAEVTFMAEMVKGQHLLGNSQGSESMSFAEKNRRQKRTQFLAGLLNVCILVSVTVVIVMVAYGESFVTALYLTAVSALKLDSLCLLDGVHCSSGWGAHGGGTNQDNAWTIVYYVVTYGIVGHFLVSTARYLGTDPENIMDKVETLNDSRLKRMDLDGDGKVTRSEFLRDRLLRGQICSEEQIDSILRNFDELDKNGTGVLSKNDLPSTA